MSLLYGFCFVVGGVFVALAAFGGPNGVDFDTDFDVDISAEPDVGSVESNPFGTHHFEIDIAGQMGSSSHSNRSRSFLDQLFVVIFFIFNLRFWTFASFVFGLMGLLLTFLNPRLPGQITLFIALLTGVLFGSFSVGVLQWLQGQSKVDSLIQPDDLVGACGVVEIPFDQNSRGKVRVEVKGTQMSLKALTNETHVFNSGDRILVLGMEENYVWVVSEESAKSTT